MSRPIVFINIQVARLVAASMVLFHHTVHQITENRVAGVPRYIQVFLFDGSVGVDIFFVISGFIMIVASGNKFGSVVNGWIFIRRRLVRIIPLYWMFTGLMVMATIVAASSLAHPEFSLSYLLSSLFFIPASNVDGMIQPVLLLGWTLNYEILFYVIFALCIILPSRIGIPLIFVVIAMLVFVGIFVDPSAPAPIIFWTRPIIIEFLFGILVGLATLRGAIIHGPSAIILMAAGIGALWVTSAIGWVDTSLRCFTVGLPATLIIVAAAIGPQIGQNFMMRLLRLGGDASYALYLSHPFVINAVAIAWRHIPIANGYAYLTVTMIIALIVAILVHLLIERPILDFLHRRPVAMMQHPIALFIIGTRKH